LLDSEQRTLFDLVALGRYIGPRVSKYAQTTDKNVDYHVYPFGKQVIKTFTANDFQFFDKNSQVITELSDTSIEAWIEFVSPGIFRRIARTIRW
jgi:hypothetical protein